MTTDLHKSPRHFEDKGPGSKQLLEVWLGRTAEEGWVGSSITPRVEEGYEVPKIK